MLAAERRIQIMNTIIKSKIVHVKDLAVHFDVSEMTIRRDLNHLAKDGALTRSHGGAVFNEKFSFIINQEIKKNVNYHEKLAIAEFAASLIKDGDTIAINTSSITVNIARFILDRKITVVTNSLEIANILSKSRTINLIITGGTYVHDYLSIEGSKTISDFSSFNYDSSYIGTNGIIGDSIFTGGTVESESKIAIINKSKRAYILAEQSKFGQRGQHRIAKLQDVKVITNKTNTGDIQSMPNVILV